MGASPEPLPAPHSAWLSPRARSVLRVLLLATLLGAGVVDLMRDEFDAGPYTGPLYLFYVDGTTGAQGLMDDTGRIVVPAGEFQDLRPISGWRSAWIGTALHRQVTVSKTSPYLSYTQVVGERVIVQAGVASRPLNADWPKVPLVAGPDGLPRPNTFPDAHAYRPARYPELLEVYAADPTRAFSLTGNRVVYRTLEAVRRTEGDNLLTGSRLFRLSLEPPTYMVTDDDGATTVRRWDGAAFQTLCAVPDLLPREVVVLQASPFTLAITEDANPERPEILGGRVRICRITDDACETLGRYVSVESIYHGQLECTELAWRIHFRSRHSAAPIEFLAARTHAGAEILLDLSGREHFPLSRNHLVSATPNFLAENLGASGKKSRHLLVHATGEVYECRSIRFTTDRRYAVLQRLDGRWLLLDASGQALGDPDWEQIEVVGNDSLFIVTRQGLRGVWSPDSGYTVPLEFTKLERFSQGTYKAARRPDPEPPPAAATPRPARPHEGILDGHGNWLVHPREARLYSLGGIDERLLGFSKDASGFTLYTPTGEERHIESTWKTLYLSRIGEHLLQASYRAQLGPTTYALLDEQGQVLSAGHPKRLVKFAHDIVGYEDAQGHIGLLDVHGKTFLEPRYVEPVGLMESPHLASLTVAPAFRADPAVKSIVICDLRTGARTPPGVKNATRINGPFKASYEWLAPGAVSDEALVARIVDPSRTDGSRISVRLDTDLQPFPQDIAQKISGFRSIAAYVSSIDFSVEVQVRENTGSWRSARVGLGSRELKVWNLVDADLQPLLSVWFPSPVVEDPRFLSFRPATGTFLVDRFGNTVGPH